MSLMVTKKKRHLRGTPADFSEIYLRAVDRFEERISMIERGEDVWGQALFFGARAIGCKEVSSKDAWDLAADFPHEASGFSRYDLKDYVEKTFSDLETTDDFFLAGEKTLALIKYWRLGMNPWLFLETVPICSVMLISKLLTQTDTAPKMQWRIMTRGLELSLEYLEMEQECYEAGRQQLSGNGTETDAIDELSLFCRQQIKNLRGNLEFFEIRKQLEDSLERASDKQSWRFRLAEAGLLEIADRLQSIIRDDDELESLINRFTRFINEENERSRVETSSLLDALDEKRTKPSLEGLRFIIANRQDDRQLQRKIINEWATQLTEEESTAFNDWMIRRTVESNALLMEQILGERISSEGFIFSDYKVIKSRLERFQELAIRSVEATEKIAYKECAITELRR
jgi:hypothetical protein